MTAAAPNPAHFLSIHYLRAIAAVMVVAVHIFNYGLVAIDDESLVHWLKQGVAIFFVISGFVMVTSTSGRATRPGEFLRKRFIRIAPLYWVLTIAWLAFVPGWDFGHLASSLLFLPSPDPVTGAMRSPLLEPGWSLNFEMFFYFVFAAILLVPEKWRVWVAAVALGLFSLSSHLVDWPPVIAYFASQLLLLFVAGMALARFDLRLPVWVCVAGFAGLATLPQFTDSFAASVFVPTLAIVAGARSMDGYLRKWKLPSLLADASYAIYLSHLFTLQICSIFVAPLLPGPLAFVVVMALACWVGVLVHRRIENPLTAACKKGLNSIAPRQSHSVA
ncbi:acyltransferase [Erythrobacter sp. SCSIO 43205]|uniref:acyltransferase family protein n=1 Tax=Erythrobacter sp. SCSIO 43205 TaxID=2779361 RepID=UPI001CA8EA37|nr:acyltransferase [Erythrobacter sp. SCSIO 43205]UAB78671.1 acyltransferase [Erythrobacter sp. SCSIO 43205]